MSCRNADDMNPTADEDEFPALLPRTRTRRKPEPLPIGVRTYITHGKLPRAAAALLDSVRADSGRQLIIKDAFKLRTLLVFGALFQLLLLGTLPYRVAVLPVLCVALWSAVTTAAQCWQLSSSGFMRGVLPGRTTARLPGPATGRITAAGRHQPLVVFHFGVRYNHPLGVLAPGAMEATARFRAMAADLMRPRGSNSDRKGEDRDYGLLGMTRWHGGEREAGNTLMFVMYFSSLEGLHRFAHDPLHRDAWAWLAASGHGHIAAFHETFVVHPGDFEAMYLDCAPTLLGAAQVPCCQGDPREEETWVSPLVSADTPALRTMMARMGKR